MDEEMLAVESEAVRTRPPGPKQMPYLVFPHGNERKDQTFYNLLDPNKSYLRSIPEMSGKGYAQHPSHEGWLIIVFSGEANSWGDCFLWNPVSLERVQLPRRDIANEFDQCILINCVLSAPPSNLNSMVFFLYQGEDCSPHLLLYCHPGGKKWRTMELSIKKNPKSGQLFCFKGRVYYRYSIHLDQRIKELVPSDRSLSIKAFNGKIQDDTRLLPPPLIGFSCYCVSIYVESFDELFMVEIYYYAERFITLQVWRMDFPSMTRQKVKTLGDHVLFLSVNSTASCSAAELGYTSGCVYFTGGRDNSLYAFDLEDGSISVNLPCQNLPAPRFTPEWVIIPSTTVSRVEDEIRSEHRQSSRKTKIIIYGEEENIINENDNAEGQTIKGEEFEQARTSCNRDAIYELRRSTIPSSSIKMAHTSSTSPWFIFLKTDDAIYNFLDPMHNERYIVNFSELLLGAKIHVSKGGWLLMFEFGGSNPFFFFNPLTRAKVELPGVPVGLKNYLISGISFSFSPTSSNCTVFAVAHHYSSLHEVHIFFIAQGESSWKEFDFKNSTILSEEKMMEFNLCLSNPIFYAEAFYCLDCNGTLGVFELSDSFSWNVLSKPQPPCEVIDQSFLVECEGKLLSVFLGHLGKWVRIFRLDFTRMTWVEVKSLEKNMLFVSRSSCFSAVAPNSRMENKIFFPRFHGEGMIFYSLDTGRYHSFESRHCAPDFYNTKEYIHCCWIEPNWSKATDKELKWLQV